MQKWYIFGRFVFAYVKKCYNFAADFKWSNMKMKKCKNILFFLLAALAFAACTNSNDKMNTCVNDTWDKVFPLSEKVNHKKVSFQNQYGFTLVGDLYTPKSVSPQDGLGHTWERSVSETVCQQSGLPAIAVSGPFGATKEQCSGLYAMKMAERGFVALAFDPSFLRRRE